MEEFLNKLYNYEYFGTYLMISIAVLVLLFIIILIFGKKDQKNREIEATKKLQQLNPETGNQVSNENSELNAFKETSTPLSVEAPVNAMSLNEAPLNPEVKSNDILEPKLENETIVVPNPSNNQIIPDTINTPLNEMSVNNMNVDNMTSLNSPVNNQEFINPVMPNENLVSEERREEEKPVLEKVEEQPFSFSNVVVEPITPVIPKEDVSPYEAKEVSVPTFNFNDIVSNEPLKNPEPVNSAKDIFSSVYAPNSEVKEPSPVEMPIKKEEDEDIELPTLKKEVEEIEKPILNDYNLNDLAGESYDINE